MKQSLAVIFGGVSSEHEISLLSSFSILSHLDREKYEIHMLGITRAGRWLSYEGPLERIKDGSWEGHVSCRPAYLSPDRGVRGIVRGDEVIPVDVVFPVLHGVGGEDGTIQGLFEMAGLPAGLPQCPYLAVRHSEEGSVAAMADRCERALHYPMFVKPSNTGSSIGIGKAKNREALEAALQTALQYSDCAIVEKCVDAREIEVAVMGNREPVAACCGEILPAREFYDFAAKYEDANSRTVIPADLPHALSAKILETAVRAYRAAGCDHQVHPAGHPLSALPPGQGDRRRLRHRELGGAARGARTVRPATLRRDRACGARRGGGDQERQGRRHRHPGHHRQRGV